MDQEKIVYQTMMVHSKIILILAMMGQKQIIQAEILEEEIITTPIQVVDQKTGKIVAEETKNQTIVVHGKTMLIIISVE